MAATSPDVQECGGPGAIHSALLQAFVSTVGLARQVHRDHPVLRSDVEYTAGLLGPQIGDAWAVRGADHWGARCDRCQARYRELGRDCLPSAWADAQEPGVAEKELRLRRLVARRQVANRAVAGELLPELPAEDASQSAAPELARDVVLQQESVLGQRRVLVLQRLAQAVQAL